MKETISKTITTYMMMSNLKKCELAKLCSVQPSIITRWLSGNHNFEIDTIFKIEQATGWKILMIVTLK